MSHAQVHMVQFGDGPNVCICDCEDCTYRKDGHDLCICPDCQEPPCQLDKDVYNSLMGAFLERG